jgi:putative ABC transport system ATP-binding protein
MTAIIQAEHLSKIYESAAESTVALGDVSLSVQTGESLAIIGKSGSGKSTLMHILATLDRPTAGQLRIDGKQVYTLPAAALDTLRNKKFGFVFQQFFLNARTSCLENVVLPLTIMGVAPRERSERGLAMLKLVGLLDKAHAKAGELSGGQKQRLCIARALITQPAVIFADEPTGNLDSENGKRIMELLFHLQREEGITLVIVTHDPDIARQCDRVVTIKDGRIQNS